MKAWLTVCIWVRSIVMAETRRKARAATFLAAREAGYKVGPQDVTVARRAPEFDACGVPARRLLSVDDARAAVLAAVRAAS